jgi:hypothetical protein
VADTELEALWALAMQVQDLVLVRADRMCSLSTVAELLDGRGDAVATNGVRWATRSALVAVLSHLSKLETYL